MCIRDSNTATGESVGVLRNMYPEMPIIGIEPEIKTAAFSSEHPTVLIMATPLTLDVYKRQQEQSTVIKHSGDDCTAAAKKRTENAAY